MKTGGGVQVYLDAFLISTLYGGEWSASRPGRFTSGIPWLESWVDTRAYLDAV